LLDAGLQQAVLSGLSHLHYKQLLPSTSAWRYYGILGVRCLSAVQSAFGNNVLPSLQLVCCLVCVF